MNEKRSYMGSYSNQIKKIYFKYNHQIQNEQERIMEILYRDAYIKLN